MSLIVPDDCSRGWLNPRAVWLQLEALYWAHEVHQQKIPALDKREYTFSERRQIILLFTLHGWSKKKKNVVKEALAFQKTVL